MYIILGRVWHWLAGNITLKKNDSILINMGYICYTSLELCSNDVIYSYTEQVYKLIVPKTSVRSYRLEADFATQNKM